MLARARLSLHAVLDSAFARIALSRFWTIKWVHDFPDGLSNPCSLKCRAIEARDWPSAWSSAAFRPTERRLAEYFAALRPILLRLLRMASSLSFIIWPVEVLPAAR